MDSARFNFKSKFNAEPLKAGDVHVWRVCLNGQASQIESRSAVLSPDEQLRAGSYRFDSDRNRFVATRGMLRKILGLYLTCGPGEIRFSYNRYGKPYLKHELCRFNVTYSRGLALIAVTAGSEVGIDAEFIDESFEFLKIARRVFSQTEVAALQARDPNDRKDTFFRFWTRNEAYLKAVGTGFSNFGQPFEKDTRWNLIDLPIDQNYKAAMAVQGKIDRIKHYCIDSE